VLAGRNFELEALTPLVGGHAASVVVEMVYIYIFGTTINWFIF
jgi:hypothetical protein